MENSRAIDKNVIPPTNSVGVLNLVLSWVYLDPDADFVNSKWIHGAASDPRLAVKS